MTSPQVLAGKIALVTGAGKGIGRAISGQAARDGADVALIGRDEKALQVQATELDQKYPDREAMVVPCDVTDEAQVRATVERVVTHFGGLDILVNAAGGTGPIETPAQDYGAEEFRTILDLNVLGTFLPCKHAIPHLIARGGGRIVNIGGTSGLRGYPNRVGYSCSKWAVRGLTRTLALELGRYDITVNDVCPNVTDGARMERIVAEKARRQGRPPSEVHADYVAQTALGRFVEEADVADAVSFLISPAARNITGHDIPVDAGWDV